MDKFNNLIEYLSGLDNTGFLVPAFRFALWIAVILVLTWLARKGVNRTISNNMELSVPGANNELSGKK